MVHVHGYSWTRHHGTAAFSDAAEEHALHSTVLARQTTSARLARVWLGSRIEEMGLGGKLSGDRLEVLRLITSELVTNVLLHTESQAALSVEPQARSVRVSVCDDDDRPPAKRERARGSLFDDGRGLHIVEDLSSGWGFVKRDPHGKCVWFELTYDLGSVGDV